jgi:DNA-directed RNA polymerase I subunit RPA2
VTPIYFFEKLDHFYNFTIAMPEGSRQKSTFNTLAREESFRNPTDKGSTIPILNEFVAPHIESFNALFDDSGLPSGDGGGRGLLSLAIKEIGERVVFDGNGKVGSESGETGWGNRMSSEF